MDYLLIIFVSIISIISIIIIFGGCYMVKIIIDSMKAETITKIKEKVEIKKDKKQAEKKKDLNNIHGFKGARS